MSKFTTVNYLKWIDENRSSLKPPVGNKMVYDGEDFFVMTVGGPNSRKDFHVDDGEELFYQIEGDITLRIYDQGEKRITDLSIRQGEMFLLPPRVPHSPQRPANTVGLVIERKRKKSEKDGFQWYCERCGSKLYEEFHHVTDLVKQLPPIFERYYGNLVARTCRKCGSVMEPPAKK